LKLVISDTLYKNEIVGKENYVSGNVLGLQP